MKNPIGYIKEQIYAKHACIQVATPEKPLDLTIAPTVIAMDSSWHKDSFHHGAFAYHTPFLGWRNWYAPTALGWGDRVAKTMEKYLALITKGDVADERVWYDAAPIPDGENKFDRRFHNLENTVGRLPSHFTLKQEPAYGPYNMQECALDMMLYYIEWSGNLEIAGQYFDDLCAIVDVNGLQIDGRTCDVMPSEPLDKKLEAFGWHVIKIDGHDYDAIEAAYAEAAATKGKPTMILAKTVKGKGVSFMENQCGWHGKAPNEDELAAALAEIV